MRSKSHLYCQTYPTEVAIGGFGKGIFKERESASLLTIMKINHHQPPTKEVNTMDMPHMAIQQTTALSIKLKRSEFCRRQSPRKTAILISKEGNTKRFGFNR
nr:hypothetical protein BCU62_09545 [Enterovibrio norvegicus]